MEELNKKLGAKARKRFLPLFILGVLVLLVGLLLAGSYVITMGDVKNVDVYSESQLKTGDTCKIEDNNLVLGEYATDNSGAYFILYRSQDEKYMGLYLKGSDKTKAETIMEDNWKYLDGEAEALSEQTISVKGKLTAMEGDEKRYFTEWFTDSGWTDEEVQESVDFRTLNTGESDIGMVIAGVLFTLGGAALAFYTMKQMRGGYTKKLSDEMTAQGLTPDRVSGELDQAQHFSGAELARSFAFVNGNQADIVPYDSLVWAYPSVHTVNHKIYGIIPAGKTVTRTVVLHDRRKQQFTISCKNEAESDSLYAALQQAAPYAIYGYSEDLQNLAATRFEDLIAHVDEKRNSQS